MEICSYSTKDFSLLSLQLLLNDDLKGTNILSPFDFHFFFIPGAYGIDRRYMGKSLRGTFWI